MPSFACVVMYDAMGVRRAAGEQAKVLNRMVLDMNDADSLFAVLTGKVNQDEEDDEPELEPSDLEVHEQPETKELNEFLGHTPLEVLGGALLGILIGMIIPIF